jgi:hypothetical protein
LRLPGHQTVTLKNIRPPAKTPALNPQAMVGRRAVVPAAAAQAAMKAPESSRAPVVEDVAAGTMPALQEAVAVLFGPENGPWERTLGARGAGRSRLETPTAH